jgi:DnaJ family protein C protein 7
MLADAQAAYGAMLELPLEASEEEQARAGLERARARAKNEHPVDWAKLLGVDAAAAGAAVKKAYRQLALVHHPDKAGKGGASAGVAKARAVMSGKLFKHVGEANRVLTDPAERAKWESAKMRAERAERVAANSRATRSAGYGYGGGSAYDRYDHYASADYFRQQYGGTSYGFDYSDDDGVEDWI